MARFGYLAEQLVIEIFSWLPADSLMRFKCLSKSLYLLIENPHFIVKQLHNHVYSSSENNFCVLLRRWIGSKIDYRKGENILSFLIYNDMIQATSEGDDFPFLMKTASLPFKIDNFVMEVEIDNIVISVRISRQYCFEKYWNGSYYWFALGSDGVIPDKYKKFIALFDMTYEVFQYILMPASCQDQDNASFAYTESLLEFNGSLALLYFPYEAGEKSFEIWAMDEFGVNGIWTKILCFGSLLGIVRPLIFVNGGQLLMEGEGGQMVSYNPKTKKVKELPIYGEPSGFQAMIYRRSVVSIHGGNKVHN